MSDLTFAPGWVSDQGASLSGMMEHGGLWVAERLPPLGADRWDVWEVDAEPRDTMWKILGRWAATKMGRLPQGGQERQRLFCETVASGRVILVVHDAHQWPGHLQRNMRRLAESAAPVVLVGDVVKIASAVGDDASFMGRAAFCIKAQRLFQRPE